MGWLLETLNKATQVEAARGWSRFIVDGEIWIRLADAMAAGDAEMSAFWSDGRNVHLAVMDRTAKEFAIASLDCSAGRFPSVAAKHAPAQRLERTIADIYGLVADGSPDERRWLDHGRWSLRHPGGDQALLDGVEPPYTFLTAEGAPLHQIPVGPVHAGIIEPGHFRFSVNGETVVRLEERLGYVHKGVEQLMRGKAVADAARIAARISGDSTVTYSFAFARAAEAAYGIDAPPRAQSIRAIMAELERLANHLGDVGAICNDASFSLIQAHCHILRERVLRASHFCFGHRLMMDRVIPGGVACDLASSGVEALRALIADVTPGFEQIRTVYDNVNSLQDRTVRTGQLSRNLVEQHACGGVIGRASGREFDARYWPSYEPYQDLVTRLVVRASGDVDARVWVRMDEIFESMSMIEKLLAGLPTGPIRIELPTTGGVCEGAAMVEGFRGDIFARVSLDQHGAIDHCHLRDPSWFQWPLLEAAIEGNIVADFPLCNKSFNCSYSGHDL